MKKHLIIAGIICAASIPPAYAVTKCVKLRPSTTCTSFSGSYYYSNWSATCGGIGIQGVVFCGSKGAGGLFGTTTDNVVATSKNEDNKYCWCKMVSPAVSSWVYSGSFTDGATCMNKCAYNCGEATNNYSSVRSGLFSGLSD